LNIGNLGNGNESEVAIQKWKNKKFKIKVWENRLNLGISVEKKIMIREKHINCDQKWKNKIRSLRKSKNKNKKFEKIQK